MKVKTINGGWYSDATLEGDTASLIPNSHILLNDVITTIPENILFLCLKRWNGSLYLAGQGNSSGKCWVYNGSWLSPCSTFGVNPCAFDYQGNLLIVTGPNQYQEFNLTSGRLSPTIPLATGSQGIRYVDPVGNIPITADSTYSNPTYNVANYYDLHGVIYGQSYINGLLAISDQRYIIEHGTDLTIFHGYRNGDNLLFVAVHQKNLRAIFTWLTVQELNATNFEVENPHPVDPIPPKPEPPKPEPEPPIPPKSDFYRRRLYGS